MKDREKKDFIEFHKIQFMFYNQKQSKKIQCNSFRKQISKLWKSSIFVIVTPIADNKVLNDTIISMCCSFGLIRTSKTTDYTYTIDQMGIEQP